MENLTLANSTTPSIGGLAFFLVYLSECLPYAILIGLGVFIGVIGNLTILAAIIMNREFHSPTYMLIFNLAIADLIVTGVIDSFILAGIFVGEDYFVRYHPFCQFIGATCLITCISSLMNLGFLSINRYLHICYHNMFKRVFTKRITFLFCCSTWIIGVLIQLPNLTGWGGYFYDPKTLNCVWNRLASQSYSIFFPIVCIVIPCISILICYIRIFIFTYKSKRRLRVHASLSSNHKQAQHYQAQSLHLAESLFGSFLLFATCWMPYGLIVMLDYSDRLPRTALMFATGIAHFNSALNPILYTIFNQSFRHAFLMVYKRLFCCSNGDDDEELSKQHVDQKYESKSCRTKPATK